MFTFRILMLPLPHLYLTCLEKIDKNCLALFIYFLSILLALSFSLSNKIGKIIIRVYYITLSPLVVHLSH